MAFKKATSLHYGISTQEKEGATQRHKEPLPKPAIAHRLFPKDHVGLLGVENKVAFLPLV